MIDLNVFSDNKTVVNCKSVKEAKIFFDEMRKYHPKYMSGWREDGASSSWQLYKKNTCYWPIRYDDGTCRLEYCSCAFFTKEGDRILSFEEVVFDVMDYGEFQFEPFDKINLFSI